MGSLGITELVIIFLIIVVLFGARRIPELMRGLGSGIREFKKAAQLEETGEATQQSLQQSASSGELPPQSQQSTQNSGGQPTSS